MKGGDAGFGFTPFLLANKDTRNEALIFSEKAGHKILYEVAYHAEMYFYFLHSRYLNNSYYRAL